MKEKLIKKSIGKGSQNLIYTELFELDGKKLKIEIQSDSYEPQCYAKIMLLDPDGWFTLHSIHYSNMKTRRGLCYFYPTDVKPSIKDEKYFTDDIKELKEIAKQLLDIE